MRHVQRGDRVRFRPLHGGPPFRYRLQAAGGTHASLRAAAKKPSY